MGEFELSATARADLLDIFEFGLDRFGSIQAERYQGEMFHCFQLLADFPGIAGKPFKQKKRDIFRFPFGVHVILFTTSPSGIRIVTVLGASMDWRRHFRRREIE